MTSLRAVISEILQSRDFRISDLDGFLSAKRNDVEVVFLLLVEKDDKAFLTFIEHFKDFKGKRVVATLFPLPEPLLVKLDERTFVWDREAIEHEIGRVHIEKIVGERDHGLVDEFGADDYPKMVTAEDLDKEMVTRIYDVSDLLIRLPRASRQGAFDVTSGLGQQGTATGGGVFQAGNGSSGRNADDQNGQQVGEHEMQQLLNLIQETVEPDSWRVHDGAGTILPYQRSIIVRNTVQVHQRLGGYLAEGDIAGE